MPQLAFTALGDENEKTILFLHGGGAAGWTWLPAAECLKDRFHCLIPDLPQHGQSAGIGPFTMESAADLTAELIRVQAKGGKAIILGLSEGAQVGVLLLQRHPELVERAILSGVLCRPMPGSRLLTRAILNWTHRLFVKPFQNSDWYIRLNMKQAVGIPEEYFPQFKADFQALTADAWANLMLANQQFRLPDGLDGYKHPVLVLTGEKEYGLMQASAQDLAAALPNASRQLVKLPGQVSLAQSHNWPINDPALCAQIVGDFCISSG